MTHEEYIKYCKEQRLAIIRHEEDDYCTIFFENIKTKKQQRVVIEKLNIYLKEYRTSKKEIK